MKFSLSLGSFNLSVGKNVPAATGKRSFAAGSINRLTSDWSTTVTSADVEARNDVTKLRSRCRELERDDPYARHYFKLLRNNVLGWQGMRLEMKVKDPSGSLDIEANTMIQDAWEKWGKKKNCTVQRNLSWRTVCWLVITAPARDGGVLLRKVRGFDNEFGFALQLLEIDLLDVYYNVPNCGRDQGSPGNEIRMGVELNQWKEPVAYHLWTRHPGDYNSASGFKRERIPAADIIHLFMPDRVMQTIGTPWITSAMLRLNMLNGYEEAELVAARTAACKGGYITKEKPEQYTGDDVDHEGNQVEEMEPGVVRELDPGQGFVEHDPKHPNTAYPAYIKQVLRGAAAGMSVNYNTLANDLEGVNYSSLRAGTLEDREEWMMVQEWFAEDLCDAVFEAWLPMSILSNQVALPMAKLDKFMAQTWQGRRWPWVDPLKDIQATVMAINNRLESRTGAAADQGNDLGELFNQIEAEEALAKAKNVELPALGSQPPADIEDDDTPPKKPVKEGEEAPEGGLPPVPKKPSKPKK
jgi:lambda family phage portal protein